jgi:hypothetical protein
LAITLERFCPLLWKGFVHDGHSQIQAISQFKFVSCFHLTGKLTYKLLHHSNSFCLEAGVPAITLARINEQIHDHCVHTRSSNFEIFEPNQFATPTACVKTFLNWAVGTHLPDWDSWIKAYKNDPKLSDIITFIKNPGTILQRSLDAAKLNANYCQELQQSSIKLKNRILFNHEPIVGFELYAKLQLVLAAFQNIVFITFHSNPLGGHLNATRTFHWICLWFYLPHRFSYITKMCNSCPGCASTNLT